MTLRALLKTTKKAFEIASALGMAATIAGSFFLVVASIPVLMNGIFGIQQNETLAKCSGGFGVGCSIPGVLGAGICTIVLLTAAAISNAFSEGFKAYAKAAGTFGKITAQSCTKECQDSVTATSKLGEHLVNYYNFLTILMLMCTILCLVESIVACISCCFWKKRVTIITTTAAPGVVAAPVVAQPVAVVEQK